jgi:putative ABC transport system permease protein
MNTLIQDLRYAVRILAKNRAFAAVAILTLALGIGATTAIFSFVYSVILRPLALRDSAKLVMVLPAPRTMGRFIPRTVTPGDFLEWQRDNNVFEQMAAFTTGTFSLTTGGDPERLLSATVTSDFFEAVGVAPIAGRTFGSGSRTLDGTEVAIIGDSLWRRRFNADPA